MELGREGEDRAASYLRERGYRIVGANVRAGGVEIDLIARRAREVVFVEVKTRRGSRHGSPEDAVDHAKQRRLLRGARAWLAEQPGWVRFVRFDVITWRVHEAPPGEDEAWEISHWIGAFDAGG